MPEIAPMRELFTILPNCFDATIGPEKVTVVLVRRVQPVAKKILNQSDAGLVFREKRS
jgi:hypothetical protein